MIKLTLTNEQAHKLLSVIYAGDDNGKAEDGYQTDELQELRDMLQDTISAQEMKQA